MVVDLEASDTTWYSIRPAAPGELPFVFESWAGTYKRSKSAGCIPNDMFEAVTFRAIEQLLGRGMEVLVLAARSHPDVILAWVAYERDQRKAQPIVHYIFTRDGFRRRGLATTMLARIGAGPGTKFLYTHQTPFARYFPQGHWEPGIARRKSL